MIIYYYINISSNSLYKNIYLNLLRFIFFFMRSRNLSMMLFCYSNPDITVVPYILLRYCLTHPASYLHLFSKRTRWPSSPKDVHDFQEKSIAFICEKSWSLIVFLTSSTSAPVYFLFITGMFQCPFSGVLQNQ